MQSPKSPSSSPKKSTRRRANTITFVNNTDDLINEFMNPTPAAPTTTTRRGLSPAWQRGTDDAEQSSPLRSAGSSMLLENSEDENSSSSDVSESVIIPNEMSSLSGTLVYSKSPGKKKKTKKTSPKNSTLYDKKKSKPFLEDYEMPTTPAPLNNSSVEYRSSLMGFRAFEKFPSGKVLKSKNINRQEKSTVNKVNDGRPKSAVKQKKPVAIHEYSYEYTVHPLYTGGRSQKQPATVRREEPEGMAVQGISLGSNRPTAPSNTKGKPTSDGKHRRSVIDTYTTNLSLKTTQTAPAKKDEKFAGVEILGEDIVGPLGDLSEKNDNIIQLGRPPVFSSETYTKAMGDPLKAVKREDDHDSDEETMLPQPPKTALFDYLTKYKMGDNSFGNSVADNSIKLNDTLSGATKTVRFLDEDRRLPSFDVETPPEYNMTGGSAPPSFAPLGGGYVPPSLQRPLMLDAPLVQSVADNPLGLPKTETVGALIPLPSTDPLAPPPPPTGLPPPPAPLPPPPPPPPLSQMPLNSSPQPINTNDDSADKLESTLPPGAMPAVPTATFPSWGDTLSTMNVAEEKKEELLLTTEEKEERKLIRQIAKAKQAASKRKAGLYGWQETPANVFFSDKEDNWIVLTDKERHFIQTLQAKEASNQITEDARSALLDTLRNDLMDEENDVDYQCITENVLDPSLCAYVLRKRYRDMSNTLVTEENTQSGSTLQDDYMPPRSSKAPKTNRTRSTMASQAVILRDPVKLLTCEHLNDDIGSTTTTRISVGTDIRMSMDSMMATAIHPVAPPGVKFCELTYAAKVLLSSILYLRALGGFPTLLRVQPLTDLSPVIDKENCIELVFWNPEPEPQPEEMAAPQTTPVSIFGRPSGEAAKRPSMAENVLGAALSGVRRRTTTFTGLSANGEVKERRTSSFSPHQAAPEPPKATVAASADNSRVASPTHRGSATGDRETVRAGMEHTLGPGVPRIQDKEKKKKLRRSSYTTYNTPGEEAVSPEASINPGKNVFQSVGEVSPWLNYGERSNSIYAPVTAANAVKVEPPHPADHKGKSRIKGTKEELCIIVRATVAQKSKVYRFGKEETVHVLPPLPSEEEYIEQKIMKETELERLDVGSTNPLSKLVAKDRSVEAQRAAESKKQALAERNKRLAARGAVDVDSKGKSNDYGDLAVGFLLSREASQLSGVLPDIVELEALRYKIFTLQGYDTQDPFGVNVQNPADAQRQQDQLAQSGRASEPRMSMAGNALFDSIQRASVAGRRSFSNSISGGLSREASFASVPSDDEGRRPLRRRSTFEQELFNRFGYNSNDLTSQQQREKQEYEQMMSKKKMFPLYRASSVSESTIQKYQLAEKEKAKRRRKAGLLQGVQLDKDDDSVALRLDDGPASYGVCVSSDEQVERKNKALQEAELELLRFRPMNLNGFYLELLQAVQLALEQQVRASKDMVKNAYHM